MNVLSCDCALDMADRRATCSENWGQIASADGLSQQDLAIRFVEYHRMVEGAGLANPKHYVRENHCMEPGGMCSACA